MGSHRAAAAAASGGWSGGGGGDAASGGGAGGSRQAGAPCGAGAEGRDDEDAAEDPAAPPPRYDENGKYIGPGTEAIPYRHATYEGLVYLPYVRKHLLDRMRSENELLERDIVVASFPKTGTTWLQTVLLSLVMGGPERLRDPMRQSVWIEAAVCRRKCTCDEFMDGWGAIRGVLPEQRVLKTHAQAHVAPWVGCADPTMLRACGAKLAITWRDPRDVAVSCFHHITASNAYRYRGTWDEFIEMFLAGGTEGGDFWEWQLGWRRATAKAVRSGDAMWVRYEDMKADLPGMVRRLQAFAGLPPDEELVRRTAEASEFGAMRALFERRNVRKLANGKKFNAEHIRKGEVGGFDELMTEEQSQEFQRRTAQLEAQLHAEGLL